jgi:hypothetical protein
MLLKIFNVLFLTMKIRDFFIIVLTLVAQQICAQNNHILFHKNSFQISQNSKTKLDSIIVDIKTSNGAESIGLSGHTDSDASDDYNKKLSFNRALAVKNYLIQNGIKNQIHIDSKGESEQLNDNSTEINKTKNRRVEIKRNYSKNNDAFNVFPKEIQIYSINTQKDTLIKCKYGSQIKIDKNIFQTDDATSPIKINIQEYSSKKDFVLSNLTTRDINNNMLETRGMINIEAFQNNKQLDLKPGNEIGILFKDRRIDDKTVTFNGITHDEEIVWDNSFSSSTTIETSGRSMTRMGNQILESSKWIYEVINGERVKITETKKNGKVYIDTTSAETEDMTNKLVLSSKRLGWINCDKFFNDNSPKIDLIVKYSGSFVPNIVIVFEDINSVLPYSFREDDKLIFKNIPSGKSVVIIGLYKSNTNEKTLFAQKKTKIKDGLIETITFEELSPNEIEQKLDAL